jgi:hypothetical protein
MKTKSQITFPEGANQSLLRQRSKKALAERERRHKQAHQSLLHRVKLLAKHQPGLNRKDVKNALAEQRRLLQRLYPREEPPPFKPLKGHNPARFVPFDMAWSSLEPAGSGTLVGPDTATGLIGAHLELEEGGAVSAISSVGFWHFAPIAATLYITVQASVTGRAWTLSGETYAGLQVYVEEYSPDLPVFAAKTDLFRSSVSAAGGIIGEDFPVVVLVRSASGFESWTSRTVSIAVPLRPDTWYAIWADAVHYVGGIGVSDFDMVAGPITFFLV